MKKGGATQGGEIALSTGRSPPKVAAMERKPDIRRRDFR